MNHSIDNSDMLLLLCSAVLLIQLFLGCLCAGIYSRVQALEQSMDSRARIRAERHIRDSRIRL